MTHKELIDAWPSLADFADDIGVEYGTAKAMRRRDSIPPAYWSTMVAKATGRGIDLVSIDSLLAAAEARHASMAATKPSGHSGGAAA